MGGERDVPEGFLRRQRDGDLLLLRRDVGDELEPLLSAAVDGRFPPEARVLAGGRGATVVVTLAGGVSAVLRRNLRGGLPARLMRDLYFGRHWRPFAEIVAGERLRRAGVPVPQGLGAAVRICGGLAYRGAVATREVAGSVNLWVHLQRTSAPERRRRACGAALDVVRALHTAGAIHPDLNLQNFLVEPHEGEPRLWLVDCDRVRFAPTGASHWRTAVARLQRSCRRLDPSAAVVDPAWFGE